MANTSEVVTFVREVKHSVLYKGKTIAGFYIPKKMLDQVDQIVYPKQLLVTISKVEENNNAQM